LSVWGREILGRVEQIAAAIDTVEGSDCYVQAVSGVATMIDDASQTPSARLLRELQDSGNSFFEYAMSMARSHRDYFGSITPMTEQRHDEFVEEARQSIERQRQIEATDSISFEEYLAHYYASE
jgi:glutamate--cysteine ligase